MHDLNIAGSQSTPAITTSWETGMLKMRGDSYPENSLDFFIPLITWIEHYLHASTRPLTFELHLLYLNTSSVKAMMDAFDMLEAAYKDGRKVIVRWYYNVENERVADLAEEFKEDCSFPFEILEYSDESHA